MSLAAPLGFVVNHPVNRRRPTRGILDFAIWQVRARLSAGPHVQPWIAGTRFFARRGETGVTGNIYTGLHEFEDMALALHLLGPDSLFVDVGANAGSYTVLAAGAAGSRVLALEPAPSTFERLQANIALNRLQERVTSLNVGVADAAGFVDFTMGEDTMNHVLPAGEDASPRMRVPVTTLDTLLPDASPELVKIDVEGYELPVLRGGTRVFSAAGANAVLVELNGSGAKYGWSDDEVQTLLLRAGYRTYLYFPFERRLQPAGRRESGNTLFIRDAERVMARVARARRFEIKGIQI